MIEINPKKIERIHRRKKILDLIKEKPRQYGDLVKLTSFSESTLKRILDELQKLGDIEKKGSRWVWCRYIYPKEYSPYEYNVAIGHAKDLLPGFLALLELNSEKPSELATPHGQITRYRQECYFLSKFAEQHLKTGYPDIHDNLVKFKTLKAKIAELKACDIARFTEKFRHKYLGSDHIISYYQKKKEPKSWFQKLFPEWKTVIDNIPYAFGPFDTKELAEAMKFLDADRTGLMKLERKKVVSWLIVGPLILKASNENVFIDANRSMVEIYGELAKQIHILKLQAQRQGLDGDCDLCRQKVVIKKEAPEK